MKKMMMKNKSMKVFQRSKLCVALLFRKPFLRNPFGTEVQIKIICQVKLGPEEHPLQHTYTFWYSKRTPGKLSSQFYDQNLKKIGSFASVSKHLMEL